MTGTRDQQDLKMLIGSSIPLIRIESHEEKRATELVKNICLKLKKPVYRWSITSGLKRLGIEQLKPDVDDTQEPEAVLKHIANDANPSVYILCDLHPFLAEDARLVRKLREICLGYHKLGHTVVLLSPELELPSELTALAANFELALPSREQLEDLIKEEARLWSKQNQGQKVRTDRSTLDLLISNLAGLTFHDARTLIRNVIHDDGAITETELPEVNQAKFRLLERGGVLSFEFETARFNEVGGLTKLKTWLSQREPVFHRKPGTEALDPPKGVLLVGVQGGGKSLAAKAVAGMWSVPLLRLDFGSLYNKYHGETEKNLRESLKLAKLMSPCVLWMDEIEKGVSTGENDGGTSMRVLGTLLTWMAENRDPVFIVSTANDISGLPPELIRKGRLDEIFFVDLPCSETRKEIFAIHLTKRKQDIDAFDLDALTAVTDGFSGSEIEQLVVSGLYSALGAGGNLSNETLMNEAKNTSPLSIVMREKLESLRSWAEGRTVRAN